MGVVGELAWLEQLLEGGEAGAHDATLQLLSAHADAVRDALYELYCDAADERLAPLIGSGALLEQHVRCCYAWCGRVVSMLGNLVQGLRSEAGPDWALAKTGFRSAAVMYVGPSEALRVAVRSLGIDTRAPPSRCAACRPISRRFSRSPSASRARSPSASPDRQPSPAHTRTAPSTAAATVSVRRAERRRASTPSTPGAAPDRPPLPPAPLRGRTRRRAVRPPASAENSARAERLRRPLPEDEARRRPGRRRASASAQGRAGRPRRVAAPALARRPLGDARPSGLRAPRRGPRRASTTLAGSSPR